MSIERVQKSASSTSALRENSAVSLKRKLDEPSASTAPQISAKARPMTTAQWLQSDLVMRTMQGFEDSETKNSEVPEADQSAAPSVQSQELQQPESEASEPASDAGEEIQTKLTVGTPGDKYEQEADSMAARVMAMPDSAVQQPIQRQTSSQTTAVGLSGQVNSIARVLQRSQGEEEEIQMKSGVQRASDGSQQASPSIESSLANSKGGGSPLPEEVRGFMEPRFNADFSNVRAHTDSSAVQMNKELGAKAFAHGSDIYYGAGNAPGNNELTAHELTHTIQQKGAKQLAPKSLVSLKSHKETFQTNSIAAPSSDIQQISAKQLEPASLLSLKSNKETFETNSIAAPSPDIQQISAKQLEPASLVSLKSNKETLPTNPSAAPSGDLPAKTLPQVENSTPKTEKTEPSNSGQKTTEGAKSQPEQAENAPASTSENQGGLGLFGPLAQVKAIADKILSVLPSAGGVIWSIVKDPVSFLGNLVAGLRQGCGSFLGNLNGHLQGGLIGWLTGTLGPMGIQIPDEIFSLKGAFSLVTQVLGITWDYMRTKAVKQFGERTVARMEKSSEIFQMLAAKGPMGLWEQASNRFEDLKETTIDQIKNTIATQVVQAGVKWMMSLLNPASGLVKAAFTIYDIVTFFTQRASSVVELVEAGTGAVKAVASGSVGGAASMVENALARSLPVAIGFMASVLGINGLAAKVQEIVKRVRVKVDQAVDGVLLKAKNFALKEKVKGNKEQSIPDNQDSQVSEQEDTEHNRKVTVGLEQIQQEQARYLKNDAISKEDAEKVAVKVKAENPVFKSITVADNKETWDYIYVASPAEEAPGARKAESETNKPESETNNDLTDKARIISILIKHKYSQKKAEKLSEEIITNLSLNKDKILPVFFDLLKYLEAYSKLPQKIEDLTDEENAQREALEKRINNSRKKLSDKKLNLLANKSIGANLPIYILLEIIGSNNFLKYNTLNFTYKQKKKAYGSSKGEKDDPYTTPKLNDQDNDLETEVSQVQESGNPMDILKRHRYHWDRARDALAYGNEGKTGDAKRAQMNTLVNFRRTVVRRVLSEAMINVANQVKGHMEGTDVGQFAYNDGGAIVNINVPLGGDKQEKEKVVIEAIAPGSSNLTSDYDVTFRIVQLPQYEAALVREFNQRFGSYFVSLGGPKYESGVVFDTNMYTSGFLGKKGSLYQPKTKETSEKLAQNQLEFSLVAILKGLPQGEWVHFQKEVIQEAKDKLELNSDGVKIINNLFKEAKEHTKKTSNEVEKQKNKVMKDYTNQLNVDKVRKNSKAYKDIEIAAQMQAANRLYEKQIDTVSTLIKEYQEAEKAYNPEAAEEDKKKQEEKIDKLSIDIYREQSLALIYANEAYYSAGPVLHVVGQMQMGLKDITTPMEYLQSLLVQIGYKLQHIQHYEHLFEKITNERLKAKKQDRVGLLFAKYGQRALAALEELTKTLQAAGVQLDLSHTSAKVIVADLRMEEIKKTGTENPQKKVSKASKAGIAACEELELKDDAIKAGQSLDLKVMKSSWKELAIQMLARTPHLLNQLKSK
jgi:hypothetical protein